MLKLPLYYASFISFDIFRIFSYSNAKRDNSIIFMPYLDVGKMLLDFPNMIVWIITMLESPKTIRVGPEFD
jgi:hypothetical protein